VFGLEKFVQPTIQRFDGHYKFFLGSKEMWQIIEDEIPLLGVPPLRLNEKL